jgi:hypothetical protein
VRRRIEQICEAEYSLFIEQMIPTGFCNPAHFIQKARPQPIFTGENPHFER